MTNAINMILSMFFYIMKNRLEPWLILRRPPFLLTASTPPLRLRTSSPSYSLVNPLPWSQCIRLIGDVYREKYRRCSVVVELFKTRWKWCFVEEQAKVQEERKETLLEESRRGLGRRRKWWFDAVGKLFLEATLVVETGQEEKSARFCFFWWCGWWKG